MYGYIILEKNIFTLFSKLETVGFFLTCYNHDNWNPEIILEKKIGCSFVECVSYLMQDFMTPHL